MSNQGISILEHQRTVIFMCRETITSTMKETGVNTLKGFNNLACALVKVVGAQRGIAVKEGEEHMWALGTLAKDDVPYLASYLTSNERVEIVDLHT